MDNGKGITSEELNMVGERYCTSKCHTIADLEDLRYFGFRGEGLASIIDVSEIVEICSRYKLSQQTYSKTFRMGRTASTGLAKSTRPSVGTTVTVHDFFYNLPVRRKAITKVLELDRIRKVVEALALINPLKSFSLRDDETGELVLQTHKTNSIVASFAHLFGSVQSLGLKEVSASRGCFKVSGYMSTEGSHNKSMQFVYVNGRVVRKTALHTCINTLLAASVIGRRSVRQADSKFSSDQDFQSPKCTPERHGVYVLMIQCPRAEYDILLEPSKTLIEFRHWDEVMAVVETAVRKHLVDYNLTLGPATYPKELEVSEMPPLSDSTSVADRAVQNLTSSMKSTGSVAEEVNLDIDCRSMIQSKTVRKKKKKFEAVQDDQLHETEQQTKKARLTESPGRESNTDLSIPSQFDCFEQLPNMTTVQSTEESIRGIEALEQDSSQSSTRSCPEPHCGVENHSTLPGPPSGPVSNSPAQPHYLLPTAVGNATAFGTACNPPILHYAGTRDQGVHPEHSSLQQQESHAMYLGTHHADHQAQTTVCSGHGDTVHSSSNSSISDPTIVGSLTYSVTPCSRQVSTNLSALFATAQESTADVNGNPGLKIAGGDTPPLQQLVSAQRATVSVSSTLSGASQPARMGPQSDLKVALNTPLRSPLQFGSASSKLAKLFQKQSASTTIHNHHGKRKGLRRITSQDESSAEVPPVKAAHTQPATLVAGHLLQSIPASPRHGSTCSTNEALQPLEQDCALHCGHVEVSGASIPATYHQCTCTACSSSLQLRSFTSTGTATASYANTSNCSSETNYINPCVTCNPWSQCASISRRKLSANPHNTGGTEPECLPTSEHRAEPQMSCTTEKENHGTYSVSQDSAVQSHGQMHLSAHGVLSTTNLCPYRTSFIPPRRLSAGSNSYRPNSVLPAKVDPNQPPSHVLTSDGIKGDSCVVEGSGREISNELTSGLHSNPYTHSGSLNHTMLLHPCSQDVYPGLKSNLQSLILSTAHQETVDVGHHTPIHAKPFSRSKTTGAETPLNTMAESLSTRHCQPVSEEPASLASQDSCCPKALTAAEVDAACPVLQLPFSAPLVCGIVMPVDSRYSESLVSRQNEGALIHSSLESHAPLFVSQPLVDSNGGCDGTTRHSSLWKEVTDPITGGRIFIHSVTGMSSTDRPPAVTSFNACQDNTNASQDLISRPLSEGFTRSYTSSTNTVLHNASINTLGTAPLRAAPHLSHDFDPLVPRPRHLRALFGTSSNSTDMAASRVTAQCTCTVSPHIGEVHLKWRSSHEPRQPKESFPSSETCSVGKLLNEWNNPTFQAGHEVSMRKCAGACMTSTKGY